jgi:hypothetical protein
LCWKPDREGTIKQKKDNRSCLGQSHQLSIMSSIQAQYFPRKLLFIQPTDMVIADKQILAPPQGRIIVQLPTECSDMILCRETELLRPSSLKHTSNHHAALSTSAGCRQTSQHRKCFLLTSSTLSSIDTTALRSSTRDQSLLVQRCSTAYPDAVCITAGITTSTGW